jgi:hypothetical protein
MPYSDRKGYEINIKKFKLRPGTVVVSGIPSTVKGEVGSRRMMVQGQPQAKA